MAHKQIRLGQIIAPFGPGSIYTDRRGTPHVVCGLDHWFKRWDQAHGLAAVPGPRGIRTLRTASRRAAESRPLLRAARLPRDTLRSDAAPERASLHARAPVSALVSQHAHRRDAPVQPEHAAHRSSTGRRTMDAGPFYRRLSRGTSLRVSMEGMDRLHVSRRRQP